MTTLQQVHEVRMYRRFRRLFRERFGTNPKYLTPEEGDDNGRQADA